MTGQQQDAVLQIADYSLSFKTAGEPFRVLEELDLTIRRGEILGLVGESGSGKSSLAYAVMRSLQSGTALESGNIVLSSRDGDPLNLRELDRKHLEDIRGKTVAMVFQDPGGSLNPTLTLGDHIAEVLDCHRGLSGAEAAEEARRLLEMVGLPDADLMLEKYPHEVSGGEKQRIVIAIAFACSPDLILFDEPTTALDATTAVNILDLFRRLQAETGVAALFISHDLGTVAEIAHRVAVIYAGRIVEDSPVEALFREPRHPYTRALLASLPRPSPDGGNATLLTFPGPLPDRQGPKAACVFEARCPFAQEACRRDLVELEDDGGHATACLRWREVLQDSMTGVGGKESNGEAKESGDAAPVLAVEDLTVRIGRWSLLSRLTGGKARIVHAVNAVDLTLNAGETLGLVGESGCGKSTLARALSGLRAFEGTIRFDGREIRGAGMMDRRYRSRVQMIFQNPDSSLNPRQKIGSILGRPLKLYQKLQGRALQERITELLTQVRLPSHYATRYPHELSGGEKQRVAIARAVAAEPAVIICDEITSGLDASVQAAIVNLLKEIQARLGIAYLFITHDLNLLRYIADRVATMYLGQIVELSAVSALARPPYHPYTRALLSSAPTLDPAIEVQRVRLGGVMPTRTEALAGCPFVSRCPSGIAGRCESQAPPLRSFGDAHWLRCHLEEESLLNEQAIWTTAEITKTEIPGETPP